MGLHTVAGCWSQPVQLCVRAQSHASTGDGQGCQWVPPLTLLWALGAIEQNICDVTALTPTSVGQSPPLAVCTECWETQMWGCLGLFCCSQGNVGGWLFSIFFSFVLQTLGASVTPVIVYFKGFVSLSFMLHRDTDCVSNEWKASFKAHHNLMLVFLWDQLGFF